MVRAIRSDFDLHRFEFCLNIFWECIDRSKWEVICTYLSDQTVTSTKLDINTH